MGPPDPILGLNEVNARQRGRCRRATAALLLCTAPPAATHYCRRRRRRRCCCCYPCAWLAGVQRGHEPEQDLAGRGRLPGRRREALRAALGACRRSEDDGAGHQQGVRRNAGRPGLRRAVPQVRGAPHHRPRARTSDPLCATPPPLRRRGRVSRSRDCAVRRRGQRHCGRASRRRAGNAPPAACFCVCVCLHCTAGHGALFSPARGRVSLARSVRTLAPCRPCLAPARALSRAPSSRSSSRGSTPSVRRSARRPFASLAQPGRCRAAMSVRL